jgi:transcriptional regulator with XRE-family HTH domain
VTLDEVITVLTEERKRRGLTYLAVSARCPYPGLSHTAIFKYERRVHWPRVQLLVVWAAALDFELGLDLKTKRQEGVA